MVNVFEKNGHKVFPMAPINGEENESFISNENGIDVLRTKTIDVFSKNKFKKGFANILLPYQFKKSYDKFWKNHKIDLVIVATPSVMFADFIFYLKKNTQAKVLLMQKDIFPQNAVDLGYMKKDSFIYNFFKKNEVKLLSIVDVVGCTSHGNISYLLKNYDFLDEKKVKILYNSTNLLELSSDQSIRSKYRLDNNFVVAFGGNLGKPQQLENVLALAKRCSVYHDVRFLIIGTGTEVEALRKEIFKLELNNIQFINKVPREDYFRLLACCNIGLISLHQNFTVPNTPMKLNDYLNAEIPVLASIDRNNDLGILLEKYNMGKFAYADSPEDLFSAFKELYEDRSKCIELGKNGKQFCLENLSSDKSYETILEIIKSV
ncbi:glycosyltransferase family 4 protein [Chryseobacterium ginsenosidimutans]|uniref:glycosyltransferase family 4 protein n=1 Tax=Chryseobacterium ginsenosidimutans TaxID=687846 RepID=UPI0027B95519|nr:glycosyltransferase family 4 protein [Chryseobacterium ginsenosidimutans]